MRSTFKLFNIAIAIAFVFALSGVSEAGNKKVVKSVPGQSATALYIQQWGQILWGLVSNQTGTQTPTFGDPVFNPDGSISQSFTTADGTEVILTSYMDGSARLDITLPNGVTQVVLQAL